jgi:hypothetical protein
MESLLKETQTEPGQLTNKDKGRFDSHYMARQKGHKFTDEYSVTGKDML